MKQFVECIEYYKEQKFPSEIIEAQFNDNEFNNLSEEIKNELIEMKRVTDIYCGDYYIIADKVKFSKILNKKSSLSIILKQLTQFPLFILNLFPKKEINLRGIYEIQLFIEGEWKIVIIDDKIPVYKETNSVVSNNELVYRITENNELWVVLVQKALAKVCGSYLQLEKLANEEPGEIFNMLTGLSFDRISLEKDEDVEDFFNNEDLWKKIKRNFSELNMIFFKAKDNFNLKIENIYDKVYQGRIIKLISLKKENMNLDFFQNNILNETNSEFWTQETKKLFSYSDDLIFFNFTEISNFFKEIQICYLFISSFNKSFKILSAEPENISSPNDCESDNNLLHPIVYTLEIESFTQFSLSLYYPNHQKYSKNKNSETFIEPNYPFFLLLAQFDETSTKIIKLEGKFSKNNSNIHINTYLNAGKYLIWSFCNYSFCDEPKPNNYIVKAVSNSNNFKFFLKEYDSDLNILRNLFGSIAKIEHFSEISKNKNLFIGQRENFKNSGFGYFLIVNEKNEVKYVNYDNSNSDNLIFFPIYPNKEIILEPHSKTIIISLIKNVNLDFVSNIQFEEKEIYTKTTNLDNKNENFVEFSFKSLFQENSVYSLPESCYEIPNIKESCKEFLFRELTENERILQQLKEELPEYYFQIDTIRNLNKNQSTNNEKPRLNWRYKDLYDTGVYIGQVNENNERHGKGIYEWFSGEKYIGSWENGLRDGYGVQYDGNGKIIYEGGFKANLRHGRGRLSLQNGDFYEGMFVNDVFEGPGRYIWSDSNTIYDGVFINAKMEGEGLLTFANGRRCLQNFNVNTNLNEININTEQ